MQRGAAGTEVGSTEPLAVSFVPTAIDLRHRDRHEAEVASRLAGPAVRRSASDRAADAACGGDRMELVELMSELARLLSMRSSTPRRDALRIAHRRIRRYAAARGLDETWCDAVMLQFLCEGRHVGRVA